MTSALVLAGHGSHISPLTAGIVWQQVDKLRALGVADEVTAAFWKESPSFATVLNTLVSEDITVVPLFTAQGYFTRSVIPAEMGLEGPITKRGQRTIRYASTLGEHPFLQQVIRKRVRDQLGLIDIPAQHVGLALIGHGTKRNLQSRAVTEMLVNNLRAENLVGEVVAVYLDDTPTIPEVYAMLHTPVIIAVPNFLALGSHTTIDVPEALGLKAGETCGVVAERTVYYTDPMGVDDNLIEVIMELAHDSGATLYSPTSGSAWDCFPAVGRDELFQTVYEQGEVRFGQLLLTSSGVRTDGDSSLMFNDVNELRDHLRAFTAFRPLATTTDLPGGWCIPVRKTERLQAVVETVYPGAVADWAAHRRGVLTTNTLAVVAARQKGMFRALADFRQADELVQQVCGSCVRHPTWYDNASSAEALPCVEACNVWLSKALETSE